MPKGGGKKSHKGKHRQFTSPEELEEQRKQEMARRGNKNAESSSEEESSDEEESVIKVNNPNRVQQKTKKLSELAEIPTQGTAQLSRRQREEIARQEAQRRYEQLHREGKTEEARADLARLAIVRKQREEAAKKREEEKKAKEVLQNKQKVQSLNAIKPSGKRGKS